MDGCAEVALLIDTNVLVYAEGSDHPLKEPATRLVSAIASGEVRATTTPEVLQEFLHVAGRRRSRELARDACRDHAELLTPLLVVTEETILRAADVFAERPSIGALDAVLVAIVLASEDLELVTADQALLALEDVPTRDLASFA